MLYAQKLQGVALGTTMHNMAAGAACIYSVPVPLTQRTLYSAFYVDYWLKLQPPCSSQLEASEVLNSSNTI